MNAEQKISRLFSSVFHPLVIPTLGLIILFNLQTFVAFSVPEPARRYILLMVFINTALLPVLSVFIMKRTGVIKDVLLDDRNDRIFPLLMASVFLFITYYLLRQVSLPSVIYFYLMGAVLLVLASLVVTFWWKISIHMVSLGGITGFLISIAILLNTDISLLIVLVFLISGLVGTSRIILNSHTLSQVFAGYFMGVGIMLVLFFYLKG